MAKRKFSKEKISKKWTPAPLPASFMLTAILGFIISALWVFPLSYNWGLAFVIFFSIMFITSIINMTRAPAMPQYQK